jgi:hypothetical protein
MSIAVSDASLRVVEMETRLPFHFGDIEVTAIPKLLLRVEATVDGATGEGIAMGGLIPGWFFKDPEMDVGAGYRKMVDVFRHAAHSASRLDPEPTPFDFWRTLYTEQAEWAAGTDYPPLLWGYGVSLVEQAVIDAVCRSADTPFADAVRENLFGIDLGSVYGKLSSYEPADLLPETPNRSTAIRHTVGLDDPLVAGDVTAGRPDDALPLTLAEYVRADGVTNFKIKLSADRSRDAARLARIAETLADLGVSEYRCTVDANEGYDSAAEFRRQWEAHAADPALDGLFDRLAYVEQPLPRDEAFTPETATVFSEWNDAPPIIVDESDGRIDTAGTALEHGYAGTSHKNCKGVFKGIANACLIAYRARTDDSREYVISAEDLTTVGPVELLQDLAVVATIGADHVERNGHHYFQGLRAFPESVQEAVLSTHGDLYRRDEDGYPTLAIDGGTVDLGTVVDAPFGVGFRPDLDQFVPLDSWLRSLPE